MSAEVTIVTYRYTGQGSVISAVRQAMQLRIQREGYAPDPRSFADAVESVSDGSHCEFVARVRVRATDGTLLWLVVSDRDADGVHCYCESIDAPGLMWRRAQGGG